MPDIGVLFDLLLIIGETDPIQKVLHYPSNDELIYLTNSTITAKTTNLDQDKSLIFFSIVLRGNKECISKCLCVTISSVRTNLMVILFFLGSSFLGVVSIPLCLF